MSKREERLRIDSPEELVGIFLEQSVGLYVKQKNNEHMGFASNQDVRQWMVEDLDQLIGGLEEQAKHLDPKQIGDITEALKENLNEYVDSLDREMTKGRDQYLKANKIVTTDPLKLDDAMMKSASKSDFAKVGQVLQGKDVKAKESSWKVVANFCKKIKLTKLAQFFDKKNEQSKQNSLKSSVQKISQKLKVNSLISSTNTKKNATPPNKTKSTSKGSDLGR